jgi:hypothetical protein
MKSAADKWRYQKNLSCEDDLYEKREGDCQNLMENVDENVSKDQDHLQMDVYFFFSIFLKIEITRSEKREQNQ